MAAPPAGGRKIARAAQPLKAAAAPHARLTPITSTITLDSERPLAGPLRARARPTTSEASGAARAQAARERLAAEEKIVKAEVARLAKQERERLAAEERERVAAAKQAAAEAARLAKQERERLAAQERERIAAGKRAAQEAARLTKQERERLAAEEKDTVAALPTPATIPQFSVPYLPAVFAPGHRPTPAERAAALAPPSSIAEAFARLPYGPQSVPLFRYFEIGQRVARPDWLRVPAHSPWTAVASASDVAAANAAQLRALLLAAGYTPSGEQTSAPAPVAFNERLRDTGWWPTNLGRSPPQGAQPILHERWRAP
jgi:hypothetical protein